MSGPSPDLVARAVGGDEVALTELVDRIQDRVFNLALRMLGERGDAEDATQEILVRVVTHLSSFRQESAFTTWVHRIALNHLLRTREKSALESQRTFEGFGAQIDQGIANFAPDPPAQVDRVLRNEVRLLCTHGMLVCLEREERAAFILGAILELSGAEAAELLELPPATYRKRLSRARSKLEEFMRSRCGVFSRDNPCRCELQAPIIQSFGMIDEKNPAYAGLPILDDDLATAGDEEREFLHLMSEVKVIDTQPTYAMPADVIGRLRAILQRPPDA